MVDTITLAFPSRLFLALGRGDRWLFVGYISHQGSYLIDAIAGTHPTYPPKDSPMELHRMSFGRGIVAFRLYADMNHRGTYSPCFHRSHAIWSSTM
jgi:hypothetical protein